MFSINMHSRGVSAVRMVREYPSSTAVSSTERRMASLTSSAPLRALDTVPLVMPSFLAISSMVAMGHAPPFCLFRFIICDDGGKCNPLRDCRN